MLNFVKLFISNLLILCCLASASKNEEAKVGDCKITQKAFNHQKLDINSSSLPINGNNLQVCQTAYSCCTNSTFDKLSHITAEEFQENIEDLSSSLKSFLHRKHNQFDEFFSELIRNAEKKLDSMFKDTYGDLYYDNADVFVKFFNELYDYYKGSSFSINDIFEKFFAEVMLRVYELIHSGQHLSDEYKQCIVDNMDTIRPFGRSTDLITPQFRRSFIATRAFVKGLETGKLIVTKASKFHPSRRCIEGLVELNYCALCQGVQRTHPCPSLCHRAMSTCFHGYENLNTAWRNYLGGLLQLLDRLDSPINIEAILDTFDVKTSEAIMILQDNREDIAEAVRSSCGRPPSKGSNFTKLLSETFHGYDGLGLRLGESRTPHAPRSNKQKKRSGRRQRSKRSAPHTKTRGGKRRRGGRHKDHAMRSNLDRLSRSDMRLEETSFKYDPLHGARKQNSRSVTALGTNLRSLVSKMKDTLRKYTRHWVSLPGRVCEARAASGPCWDGRKIVSPPTVADESDKASLFELDLLIDHVIHPSILSHARMFEEATVQLKQAYRGIDPLTSTNDDEDSNFESSGEGSGSNPNATDVPIDVSARAKSSPSTTIPCEEDDCGDAPSLSSDLLLIGCSILFSLCFIRFT